MGKPTGFMEIKRELPKDKPPLERIRDWNEFHCHMPEEKLREQGARCMDCGVPFCHVGMLLAGMAAGCPLSNLIPEWNDLIYRGLWREALNSDASDYGGSGLGNAGSVEAEPVPQHGRPFSLSITLPPLSALYFTAG